MNGPAQERYAALEADRLIFLNRARDCAALTVPFIMPPQGFTSASSLPTPYQSLGARGVRTLASKLLLALFPPNTPFFKYNIDDYAVQKLTEQAQQAGAQVETLKGEIDSALSRRERAILNEIDGAQFRPAAFTALQHLIVTGNYCLYVPPKGGRVRGFRLDQFVVKRDAAGNILYAIIKEKVSLNALPQDVRDVVALQIEDNEKDDKGNPKNLELYTYIRLEDNGMWHVNQECKGITLPGDGTYPPDKCPWVFLRLSTQPGEDYGRSYVEEYLGDLDSLEGLSETLVEGSAAAARVVFMVRPNGVTQLRVVAKARNGDVISGDVNDVAAMQVNKQADLSVAREQANDIGQRLAYAFLLNTAIQRQGERVTAEEIRYMAQELDDALGGVYTLLGSDMQLPIVTLFSWRMETRHEIPPLPPGTVTPQITTGMQAIGRGYDLQNLKSFVADIVQILGPELAARYIQYGELIKRSAAAYGIDTQGLIKSDQQIAQEEQQAQQAQMIQQMGPQAIGALGGVAKEYAKGHAGQVFPQPGQQPQPSQGGQ